MRRHWIAAFVAVWIAFTVPALGTEEDAQAFIVEMLSGVEATPAHCPVEVAESAKDRQLTAVCASFEGDFDLFEARWKLHLERDAFLDQEFGSGRVPLAEAATAWEVHEGIYERIYFVGENAVGVRFARGSVVMVYK